MISSNLYSIAVEKAILKMNSNEFKLTEKQDERGFDLNTELIQNREATFFMRVNTNCMSQAGIFKTDIIVADRSLRACSGHVIIAIVDGDMLIRRFEKNMHKITLHTNSNDLAPINIDNGCKNFSIWGVVTYVIHKR